MLHRMIEISRGQQEEEEDVNRNNDSLLPPLLQLDGHLQLMEGQKKDREEESKEKMNSILKTVENITKRVEIEVSEAEKENLCLQSEFASTLANLNNMFLTQIDSAFNDIETSQLPSKTAQVDEIKLKLTDFYEEIVPPFIHTRSGQVRDDNAHIF